MNLPDDIRKIHVLTPEEYELEIFLLKVDLEYWRKSVNLNILIKLKDKIKELEAENKLLKKKILNPKK